MSVSFKTIVAFDDNTPKDRSPFSCDPSVWSLMHDYGLSLCGDYRFFDCLGYSRLRSACDLAENSKSNVGLPSEIQTFFEMEDLVGSMNVAELNESLAKLRLKKKDFSKPVQVLVGLLNYLASVYGRDRVILVYAFLQ